MVNSDCGKNKEICRKTKSFKDPAYGYIEIDVNLVRDVIDTPAFQRLRRIIQTSYEPLYPSATHNRFVHSLGVYHLGNYVSEIIRQHSFTNLTRIIDDKSRSKYERCLEVFRYACLLHDVGHAPFSHTGESFYLPCVENKGYEKLHQRIANLCNDETLLLKNLEEPDKIAAPHELMSIIIALSTFSSSFETNLEKTFFARAIAGYPFSEKEQLDDGIDASFLNCLVLLLHSSPIDVDRLDYLIRDALETGFSSVSIDYQRLLGGVRIIDHDGRCEVAFTKQAVSVLENVVYAHDSERKWIQSHPVIGYEAKLLTRAFTSINKEFACELENKTIFCEDALTAKGITPAKFHKAIRISYLCDADVLFLLKNTTSQSAHQYLDRRTRYIPFWKSEAEFCAIFNTKEWKKDFKRLKAVFDFLVNYLVKRDISEICDEMLQKLECESKKAKAGVKKSFSNANEALGKAVVSAQMEILLQFVAELKRFALGRSLSFKFQIFDAKTFSSGFAQDGLPNLWIELHPNTPPVKLEDIMPVLGMRPKDKSFPENIYYIFHERINVGKSNLTKCLIKKFKIFITTHADAIDNAFKKKGIKGVVSNAD